jgi:hypothetical protein
MKKTDTTIPTYLGDGVFVQADRGMIKLTTSSGVSSTNTIYLEDLVVDALIKYLVHIGWLSFPQPEVASNDG